MKYPQHPFCAFADPSRNYFTGPEALFGSFIAMPFGSPYPSTPLEQFKLPATVRGSGRFGSLGLAALAYGLLLLAVVGADAEASFLGEAALPL